MKTLRIVGALFWLGCGWCAGDAACRNARRHLEALEETLLLLQRVRQEIDYRGASFAGETLWAETWGENPKGARFDRCTTICGEDGSLRVEARTTWVIMDRELKRPARLRPELVALFLRG